MTSYNTHIHDITVVHEIYADKQNYITLDIIQFLQNKSKNSTCIISYAALRDQLSNHKILKMVHFFKY